MALDPAVAAVRSAVRASVPGGARILLVACSGGADSLALLSAAVFAARNADRRVIGVTVDHGLQSGSEAHAERVVAQMAEIGAHETASVRVRVEASAIGIEAGARQARYAALSRLAEHFGAEVTLLGHTLDDQAETVLLGLARGSGGRSLAGMRPAYDGFVRPLLGLTRAQTEAACAAEGLDWWSDPHNEDPRFARSRVRHAVLPVLERELGPGVARALARTADALRADTALLDELAEAEFARAPTADTLDIADLAALPQALRTRVLRLAALEIGASAAELTRGHILALDALVTGVDGVRRALDLPGPVHAIADRVSIAFGPGRVGPEP